MKKRVGSVFILCILLAIPLDHICSAPSHGIKNSLDKTLSSDSLLIVLHIHRGDIQWEKSSDCENWTEMIAAHSDTLQIGTDTAAYYRAKVTEGTCLPLYSDTIFISPTSNKKISPEHGDTLRVLNYQNDLITLIIPPYALQDTTTVTILPLFSAPENPFVKNIFPGVRILPDSLRLLRPATLRADMSSGIIDTSVSAMFFLHDSSLAYPLGNPEITESSIQGEIYHFSSYFGGEPGGDEIMDQTDQTGPSGSSNPFDWQGTYTLVEGLLQYAQLLMHLGNTEQAQRAIEKANQIVENDAWKFMEEPIPENPCGWYLQALLKFGEKVNLLVDEELHEQISDRTHDLIDSCTAAHGIAEYKGEIKFKHQVTFSADNEAGYEYNWDIQGSVPFFVCILDYITITGLGFVEHDISGYAAECEITGHGLIPVWITGKLSFANALKYLDMTIREPMFQDYELIYVCPGFVYVSPQPALKRETNVRFIMEEGYEVTIPVNAPGAEGNYVYTLHIAHLPN